MFGQLCCNCRSMSRGFTRSNPTPRKLRKMATDGGRGTICYVFPWAFAGWLPVCIGMTWTYFTMDSLFLNILELVANNHCCSGSLRVLKFRAWFGDNPDMQRHAAPKFPTLAPSLRRQRHQHSVADA